MRSRFAVLLAIAAVCVTTAWADWTSESLVTGSPDTWRSFNSGNHAHKVVFGTDRVGHLVYQRQAVSESYSGIWYNRYNPGSGGRPGFWGADFAVAPASPRKKVQYSAPCIALDGDGRTIHVVWRSGVIIGSVVSDSVCYRRCTQDKKGNDRWDAVLHLYASNNTGSPAVACVPNEPNHVLVCWKNGSVTRFREYVNGAWAAVVQLDSSSNTTVNPASIAAASNGDVFVAYLGNEDDRSGPQIFVKTRHNGVWGQAVNVTRSFSSLSCILPTIEVNPITNNPHLAFERKWTVPNGAGEDTVRAVCHTFRNASGDWLTTPEVLSEPRRYPVYQFPYRTTMAFGSSGAAHVVWYDTVPPASGGIMYSYCTSEGGTWSTPELIATDKPSSGQFITAEEPAHSLHVVWARGFPPYNDAFEIWWKSNYPGGGDGPGAQPMALPQSRIELFPNPAKAGRVTVQYSLPQAEPITVTLLDVSGRVVRRGPLRPPSDGAAFGVQRSGEGSFAIDVRGLNPGVYVMKLESSATSLTRKLVIQ